MRNAREKLNALREVVLFRAATRQITLDVERQMLAILDDEEPQSIISVGPNDVVDIGDARSITYRSTIQIALPRPGGAE